MADDIWICEKQTVTKWDGDILSYKEHLKKAVMKDNDKDCKKRGLENKSKAKSTATSATSNGRGNW